MAYLLEEMVDKLGFEDGEPHWTSDDHRRVAMFCLLGNPRVTSRDTLMECVEIINALPHDRVLTITFAEMKTLGVPVTA